MPTAVVHGLEVIEIEVTQHMPRLAATRCSDALIEPPLEFAAIHQSSQCIVCGLVRHLARDATHLGDIVQQHRRAHYFACCVAHRRCRQFDRAFTAIRLGHQNGLACNADAPASRQRLENRIRERAPIAIVNRSCDLDQRLAVRLGNGDAKQRLCSWIHVFDFRGAIRSHDRLGDGLQC